MNKNFSSFLQIICLVMLTSFTSSQALANQAWANNLKPAKQVSLQLKWSHQFQFAGYYMAKEKGFYQQHGLDVNIIAASPQTDPIQQVLQGHADFGVGTSELLLHHQQGEPLVALGVIFQHSPLALITLQSSAINKISDLDNKKLMIEENSSEVYAYLKKSGVNHQQLQTLKHSFSVDDLINGRVDAMTAYTTTETYALSEQNIPYKVFTPRMAGIDFYGDNFFTTQATLTHHTEMVEAFRLATIEGWKYAMTHIDETIEHIIEHYPTDKSKQFLAFEAEAMQALMRTDLIEPGHMSVKRWQHIASVYQDLGLINSIPQLDNFIYQSENTIYRLQGQINYLLLFSVITIVMITLILFFTRRFYRVQTQLTTMINQSPLAVILLNDKFEVIEWNDQAEKTFGWSARQTLHHNIFEFLVLKAHKNKVRQTLKEVMESQKTLHLENKNYTIDGREITCNWSNAPFHSNGQNFIICMALDSSELRTLKALSLEKASYDEQIDSPSREHFLVSLVKTMQLSLQIWEESTSKSKVQFAEQSGLWRVSLDGSTAKTRTLDKYLSIDSVPKNPRWKQVINTANFILREFPEHPKAGQLNQLKQSLAKH